MGNSSFIAIPPNIDDPIVLRRILDKIVEVMDLAFGNRGNSKFTVSGDVTDEVNSLNSYISSLYSKSDGSTSYTAPVGYKGIYSLGDLDLTSVNWVKAYTPSLSKQTAPALINSSSADADIKANADKIDNLINILKSAGILI